MLRSSTPPAIRLMAALAVALLVFAAFPSPASAERTIAISSGSFEFEVDPGEQMTGEVVVINPGEEPIKVLVYTADQEFDETGQVSYSVPNRSDPDFARRPTSWVRLEMPADAKAVGNTPYLEMEPGERVPVSFLFQPPANATPGDHNVVLFFEMFEFSDEAGGVVSQVTGRVGSRLQMRVRGAWTERLTVQPFVVPWLRVGSEIPYELALNNTGNLDQRLSVATVLFDRNRVEVARDEPLLATLVFADTSRVLEGTVEGGGQFLGRYALQAEVYRVDDEGQILDEYDPIVEQRDIWLVPVWLLIALGVFVLALLVRVLTGLLARRREAERERAAERERRRERSRYAEEPYGHEADVAGRSERMSDRPRSETDPDEAWSDER